MSTIKERVWASVGAAAVLITVLGAGYTLGKDTNDSLVDFLKEKNLAAEKAETQLRAEISSLKLELQSAKSVPLPPITGSGAALESGSDSASAIGTATGELSAAPANTLSNVDRVELSAGQSANLFDGKIVVSLISLKLEGPPWRHTAVANVGAPGKQNKLASNVDVGSVIPFEGYEVRLMTTSTFNATFLVTRIDQDANLTPQRGSRAAQ